MATHSAPDAIATVTAVHGIVYARDQQGNIRKLLSGDVVKDGEVVVAASGSSVDMAYPNGDTLMLKRGIHRIIANALSEDSVEDGIATASNAPGQNAADVDVDRIIQAIEQGKPIDNLLEATAAGLAGGGAQEGHGFVRLDRISEGVTAAAFDAPVTSVAAPIAALPDDAKPEQEEEAVNHAPAAQDDHETLLEDTTLHGNVLANDTDVDGDTLTVTGYTIAGNATLHAPGDTVVLAGIGAFSLDANGSYTFVPAQDYDGAVPAVTYTITDGHGGTDSATLTINMVGGDDTPVAGDDHAVTDEDTPVTIPVLANDSDVDGDPLAIVKIATTAVQPGDTVAVDHGAVTLNADGTLTFSPDPDYNGTTSFAYTITDGTTEVPATVYVKVNPVNDPPVANDDVANTPINSPVDIDVKANDSDPDNNRDQLAVTNPVLADPSQGIVSVNPDGSLHFVPAQDFSGQVEITYTLTDPDGLADTATVTVTVGDNTPPEGADITRSTAEDTAYVIQKDDFGFSDPDAGQTFHAVRIDSLPTDGTLTLDGQPVTAGQVVDVADIEAGKLRYLPDANENGSPYGHFTFSVQDSSGAYDDDANTFTLDVTPVNDAPDAVANHYVTPEDTATSGNLITDDDNGTAPGGVDSDIDGDSLRVTRIDGQDLVFDPVSGLATVNLDHGVLAIKANGDFTFTPAANYNGTQAFAYTVADPDGLADSATVGITVDSINDAPVANDDPIAIGEDVTSTFDPRANDTDMDTPHDQLVIVSLNGQAVDPANPASYLPTDVYDPVSGTLAGRVAMTADGQVKFDPAPDYNSDPAHPLVIPYTVSDGQGGSDSANITVNVTPDNDAPVASDDHETLLEDTTLHGNVLANDTDVDGDTLTVTGYTIAGNATLH
ncbi:MAG: retention module-containing protein, partial [Thiobacillus sp.]|nr:retention module-containing protein [Thiobacillus sp.]